ncbi:MAG: ComEC/Rec2 family competence protein [Phycisphaerae bacterium]|nr:ComEC/Rec2 family competence protein [Phycisphaerae bacterium]
MDRPDDLNPPSDDVPARPAAPLVGPAIALMVGIMLAARIERPWIVPAAMFAFAVLGLVPVARPSWHARIAIAALAAALGALRFDAAAKLCPADHVIHYVAAEPVLATLRGRIADAPAIDLPPEPTARLPYALSPRTRFLLDAEAWIDTRGQTIPVTGRVRVSISEPVTRIAVGDAVDVFGWVYRPPLPANPGEHDYATSLRRQGVFVALSANTAEAVRFIERPASAAPHRWLNAARLRLTALLLENVDTPEDAVGSVLEALVLAQRSQVERTINTAYFRTGCSHLLAASGLNVGWLAMFVAVVGLARGWTYRTTTVWAAIVVTAYALLAEPNAPILRAAIMTDLACLAVLIRRRFNALNWLAASAIIILLISPAALLQPSFQLSFIVLLALVTVTRRVDHALSAALAQLRDRIALAIPFERPWLWRVRAAVHDSPPIILSRPQSLARWLRFALVGAVVAWLSGAPLALWHFGSINLLGWLYSVLIAPLAFVVMIVGFLKLVAGLAIPSSAAILGPVLQFITAGMNQLVETASSIRIGFVEPVGCGATWLVACYTLLTLWVTRPRWTHSLPQSRMHQPMLLIASAVLTAWPAVGSAHALSRDRDLTVWTLAVGNGTATFIELPDGRTLLYDAGTRSPVDAGERTIKPFLRSRAIRRIHAAFVSHPDLDHYSAIESLIGEVAIDAVILNEHFEPLAQSDAAATRFLARIRNAQIPIRTIAAPWRMLDIADVEIDAVWPPPADAFINDDNNSSTCLSIRWKGRRILLTGDITQYAVDQLLERGGLSCDVLALPHHGSVAIGWTDRFLAATGDPICVRSSGQRDAFTANGLLDLMRGRRYYNTADDGCVRVVIRPDGSISVETTRSRYADRNPSTSRSRISRTARPR